MVEAEWWNPKNYDSDNFFVSSKQIDRSTDRLWHWFFSQQNANIIATRQSRCIPVYELVLMAQRLACRDWRSGGPRFKSHPRLTFQSWSSYQLNQLGSKAASDSTLKQLTTCGVSNSCTLLFTSSMRCRARMFCFTQMLGLVGVMLPTKSISTYTTFVSYIIWVSTCDWFVYCSL